MTTWESSHHDPTTVVAPRSDHKAVKQTKGIHHRCLEHSKGEHHWTGHGLTGVNRCEASSQQRQDDAEVKPGKAAANEQILCCALPHR